MGKRKTQTQHYSLGVEFCGDKIRPFIPVAITAQTPTIQQSSWSSI